MLGENVAFKGKCNGKQFVFCKGKQSLPFVSNFFLKCHLSKNYIQISKFFDSIITVKLVLSNRASETQKMVAE
jgi:hypothetical protein